MTKITAVKCDGKLCTEMIVDKRWSTVWPIAKSKGWTRSKNHNYHFCSVECSKSIGCILESLGIDK